MKLLTTEEAAQKLGISPIRVRVLIREGRLPATSFGKAYAINEADLSLVAERKTGRPPKQKTNTKTNNKENIARQKSVKNQKK